MRNDKTTRFIKGIRLTQKDYNYIFNTKGKKSMAGRLEAIIKKDKDNLNNKTNITN